jgi:hypothetical protein
MSASWWAGRVRQFVRYVTGRVPARERDELKTWLTPKQLALFDEMHRADRRHGLDVVAALRKAGHDDPDLLMAGLLHDCGKGRSLHVWHRIGWSIAERRPGLEKWVLRIPTFKPAFAVLAQHVDKSAELALAAGCTPRTADLIRNQSHPADAELVKALQLADDAS